jgi:hypothetical protein
VSGSLKIFGNSDGAQFSAYLFYHISIARLSTRAANKSCCALKYCRLATLLLSRWGGSCGRLTFRRCVAGYEIAILEGAAAMPSRKAQRAGYRGFLDIILVRLLLGVTKGRI